MLDLAAYLGVDDPASPTLVAACAAWRRWCADDPQLAVVDELRELPEWTRATDFAEKSIVLRKLAALTAHDSDAVTALVWLLHPGAVRIATELRDLHADIDSLVAGQLWIETSRAHQLTTEKLAAAILATTRREVCAELGIGELARRRDRAWAEAIGDDRIAEWLLAPEREPDPEYDVLELLKAALHDDVVSGFDLWVLWDLAQSAHRLGAPGRRGRMGLTSPAVVDAVAHGVGLSSRTLRRRAAEAMDRLAEYAVAREDPDSLAAWKRAHPLVPLTARQELELAIREEEWWCLVTEKHMGPEEAQNRVWPGPGRRRRA